MTIERRHCRECNAPRKGETCWKCGTVTHVPHPSWEYPAMPPVDRIRALAKEVGYAIGEHGSKERDLDLIAAPWTENAVSAMALLEHIAKGLNAKIRATEDKPLGRFAATIQIDGWFMNIDLSVCPIVEQASQPQVPDGWKLVPIEPTEEMVKSVAVNVNGGSVILPSWRAEMYRAMIAAAPKSA